MMLVVSKTIWCVGVIGWFVIRYPHARRATSVRKIRRPHRWSERGLLIVSTLGLGIIPAVYIFGGGFQFAEYPIQWFQPLLGAALFGCSLYLFRLTHKQLGRNWSVTLEIAENHALIVDGVYRVVRHPMYSAFWLWAIAQAVLLPNWIAGPSGILGFGTLFFLRVFREETMMLATFGDTYRSYMDKTWRICPYVF